MPPRLQPTSTALRPFAKASSCATIRSSVSGFAPRVKPMPAGGGGPPVRGRVVLGQGHEASRAGERGIVERVDEADLALSIAPAEIGPPRLPVVQGRAAVRLAILAERGHPALEVVHPELAEAH